MLTVLKIVVVVLLVLFVLKQFCRPVYVGENEKLVIKGKGTQIVNGVLLLWYNPRRYRATKVHVGQYPILIHWSRQIGDKYIQHVRAKINVEVGSTKTAVLRASKYFGNKDFSEVYKGLEKIVVQSVEDIVELHSYNVSLSEEEEKVFVEQIKECVNDCLKPLGYKVIDIDLEKVSRFYTEVFKSMYNHLFVLPQEV